MRLQYYLIPMNKAAAWQVVDGVHPSDEIRIIGWEGGLYTNGRVSSKEFATTAELVAWIAAVHKHLAEWAYGKEEVPEAVREADEMLDSQRHNGLMGDNMSTRYKRWREKWMKPREPKHLGNFLWEV